MDRVLAHAETLAVNIGARPAGSANELAAADYLRDELASYGYEAELQPFPIETYETARSDLNVSHESGPTQIEATPLVGSSSATETGQLVAAGLGYPGDFPAEANGNIVLIERGEIEFSLKVANARAAGAVAAVIYNNERGPFVGQLSETPGIPVVSIARGDGESLLDLMANETLTATVAVENLQVAFALPDASPPFLVVVHAPEGHRIHRNGEKRQLIGISAEEIAFGTNLRDPLRSRECGGPQNLSRPPGRGVEPNRTLEKIALRSRSRPVQGVAEVQILDRNSGRNINSDGLVVAPPRRVDIGPGGNGPTGHSPLVSRPRSRAQIVDEVPGAVRRSPIGAILSLWRQDECVNE
ncbi:MAG: hypothetical protein IH863_07040, partial [Chloroflexi bacterium]|nr:hypothetical protein [Chloroflexota bacterium]